MPRSDSLILLVVSLVAFGIAVLSSCSSAPKPSAGIPTCLTDPVNNLLHCDGKPKAWKDSAGYVCHPLEQWQTFFEACRP